MIQLTSEQGSIKERSDSFKINALAGTGKTTTLCSWAVEHHKKRTLAISFNKSSKDDLLTKQTNMSITNMHCMTAHGLAYKYTIAGKNIKIDNNVNPAKIVGYLNIRDLQGIPNSCYMLAKFAYHVMLFYANNPIENFNIKLESFPEFENNSNFIKNYDRILILGRALYELMADGDVEMCPDIYLKMFWESKPKLQYDAILFDEGQDASPVMVDIFMNQIHANRIIVGDQHQQIYGWRFAQNAMLLSGLDTMNLTGSFRFGDRIATVANSYLEWKKRILGIDFSTPDLKGLNNTPGSDYSKTFAVIARSNVGLFQVALNMLDINHPFMKAVYFEGGFKKYLRTEMGSGIYDIISLYNNQRGYIRDPIIKQMRDFTELEEFANITDDHSLKICIDLVRIYKADLPVLIKTLASREVLIKSDAKIIFTTAHSSKGMEYDEVVLQGDFMESGDIETAYQKDRTRKNRLEEEINLLYVGVTRCKGWAHVHPKLNPFLGEKPTFLYH